MEDTGEHPRDRSLLYLKWAFLAAEPPSCLISLARESGGGFVTPEVQNYFLEHCIGKILEDSTAWNHEYIKNVLKKIIVAAEESSNTAVEHLYEKFSHYLTSRVEEAAVKENERIYKQISFLTPTFQDNICLEPAKLVVRLLCSSNMLEGDTGCCLWPSSLFLSEFILLYPEIFLNKICFEVGSGVGLVGISLCHVGPSKVILTDGDLSTLANMKANLELNNLSFESIVFDTSGGGASKVQCGHLPWELASESMLRECQPDIILGADIIYDPVCVSHLIRVLSILLKPRGADLVRHGSTPACEELENKMLPSGVKDAPVSYVATVIRNSDTFNYFMKLANEANIYVLDITETMKPLNLLPYMLSYDRSSVHLLRLSMLSN